MIIGVPKEIMLGERLLASISITKRHSTTSTFVENPSVRFGQYTVIARRRIAQAGTEAGHGHILGRRDAVNS